MLSPEHRDMLQGHLNEIFDCVAEADLLLRHLGEVGVVASFHRNLQALRGEAAELMGFAPTVDACS